MKKMSLNEMKSLSRNEMKKIMAGSSSICAYPNTQCWFDYYDQWGTCKPVGENCLCVWGDLGESSSTCNPVA